MQRWARAEREIYISHWYTIGGFIEDGRRIPGHPITTAVFSGVSLAVVVNTTTAFPADTLVGFARLAVAVPAYYLLRHYD